MTSKANRDPDDHSRLQWEEPWNTYLQLTEDTKLPNIDDIYAAKSNHLKAADLPHGKAARVTISGWEEVDFNKTEGQPPQKKVVLAFEGREKTLVVNRTNAGMIAHNLNSKDPNDWVGKSISIYSTVTDFQGKEVPCIRVKEEAPAEDISDVPF